MPHVNRPLQDKTCVPRCRSRCLTYQKQFFLRSPAHRPNCFFVSTNALVTLPDLPTGNYFVPRPRKPGCRFFRPDPQHANPTQGTLGIHRRYRLSLPTPCAPRPPTCKSLSKDSGHPPAISTFLAHPLRAPTPNMQIGFKGLWASTGDIDFPCPPLNYPK